MFFGRPVTPALFFSGGGVSRFVESGVRIGTGDAHAGSSGHDNGLRTNPALLQERFGRVNHLHRETCAGPLRPSVDADTDQQSADAHSPATNNVTWVQR